MGPRYRAAGSLKSLKMVHLEGVLGDDFVGLVLAFSDTHEPEHPRRRGTAPCASRGREGHRRRAPGRRDRFALNRGSGWGWWVGMSGQFAGRGRPSQQPTTLPRRVALVVLTGRAGPRSGEAQNVGVAPLCALGLRVVESATVTAGERRRRGSPRMTAMPGCGSDAGAQDASSPHTAHRSRTGPPHQSLSFALRNQAALPIRAGGARWPSN